MSGIAVIRMADGHDHDINKEIRSTAAAGRAPGLPPGHAMPGWYGVGGTVHCVTAASATDNGIVTTWEISTICTPGGLDMTGASCTDPGDGDTVCLVCLAGIGSLQVAGAGLATGAPA